MTREERSGGEPPLWAHSRNEHNERDPLEGHLRRTGALARAHAEPFGAGEVAEFLGLAHDVGKGSCAWQAGLLRAEQRNTRVGIDHKTAGTLLACQYAAAFALVVYGHHGGIPSWDELQHRLRGLSSAELAELRGVIDRVARIVPEIRPATQPALPGWYAQARQLDKLVADLLLRMTASAVFDADVLDTERHRLGVEAARSTPRPSWEELVRRFETERLAYLAARPPGRLDAQRRVLYEQAVAAAALPPGMFRLAAPTGLGKTIATGGFAVHHARHHKLRQVIVAVPFISITQQNAQVYRKLLDQEGSAPVVLEHHSGLTVRAGGPEVDGWQRLAAENWDAPFVVTTTVQLFHSLFSNRPSAMRKLHRLARAVVVLDEVQALPDRLLLPILSALRGLTERFGTTVLLSSATQPEFWALSPFKGLACQDIVPEPKRLFAGARRVRYEWRLDPRPTLAAIAKEAAAEARVLVVVNTTADAVLVHQQLAAARDAVLGPVWHLSTRMAAAHRRWVLARVQARLAAGAPVAVVSTSLIEAGVDLDFPVVFRAFAPADSLQQAAGRANREGRLPGAGRVVVFDPADGGQPRDQAHLAALTSTRQHFGPGRADPDDLDALTAYYQERYGLQGVEDRGDGAAIQAARARLDFPEVARRFDLFGEETVQVAIPGGSGWARSVLGRLRSGVPVSRQEFRRLQRRMATLTAGLAYQAERAGLVAYIAGGLFEWLGDYDRHCGIVLNDARRDHVW